MRFVNVKVKLGQEISVKSHGQQSFLQKTMKSCGLRITLSQVLFSNHYMSMCLNEYLT